MDQLWVVQVRFGGTSTLSIDREEVVREGPLELSSLAMSEAKDVHLVMRNLT